MFEGDHIVEEINDINYVREAGKKQKKTKKTKKINKKIYRNGIWGRSHGWVVDGDLNYLVDVEKPKSRC